MGNRAVVAIQGNDVGVYLHWNGGAESVLAFLEVCKRRGYRTPASDDFYSLARFIGVCHEFFDGGLSLGVGPLSQCDTDNGDNGLYILGPGWEIATRTYQGPKTVEELDGTEHKKFVQIVEDLLARAPHLIDAQPE